MKRTNYLELEIIKQGSREGRGQLTLAEFDLIREAVGVACADSTDRGKSLNKKYMRLLNKLNAISKGVKS